MRGEYYATTFAAALLALLYTAVSFSSGAFRATGIHVDGRPPRSRRATSSRDNGHSVEQVRLFRLRFFGDNPNRPKHKHRCARGSRYDIRYTPP